MITSCELLEYAFVLFRLPEPFRPVVVVVVDAVALRLISSGLCAAVARHPKLDALYAP